MLYKRFTEKSAEEWRQIYKSLQLMEFLVKNGSERVIDDARSHLSLLKMLRQFHYVDQNGKDQGVNVRNRSKELTDLLSDVEKIRAERKKAKATRNKYTGVEGGASLGMGGSSSRYGGFGPESGGFGGTFGGSTRSVYGDGGGFGGEGQDDLDAGGRRGGSDRFDEYDEYDDGGATAPTARRKAERPSRSVPKKAEPPKPKEPEQDLFDFGDDDLVTSAPAPTTAPSNGAASTPNVSTLLGATSSAAPADDDDDFDDFQSATPSAAPAAPSIPKPNYSSVSTAAPTSATQYAQPSPQSGASKAEFSNLFATTSRAPSTAPSLAGSSNFSHLASQGSQSTSFQPSGPNYFTSVQVQNSGSNPISPSQRMSSPAANMGKPAATNKKASGDAFAGLLGAGGAKKGSALGQKGLTIADMAKQKSQAGLYGANAPTTSSQPSPGAGVKPSTGSGGMDDLLG